MLGRAGDGSGAAGSEATTLAGGPSGHAAKLTRRAFVGETAGKAHPLMRF